MKKSKIMVSLMCVITIAFTLLPNHLLAVNQPILNQGITSFKIELPNNCGMKGVGVVDKNTITVVVPENVDRSCLIAKFETSSNDMNVKVEGEIQESGQTINNFTSPITYKVEKDNKLVAEYTVNVTDWKGISGERTTSDVTGIPERPYEKDYSQMMTMKIFLADPDIQGSRVVMRFDEVLDLIKQVDNITRGIPKIYYLVGWQYDGHDSGYPSWTTVNKALKCRNCNHKNSTECLKWLMDEGFKYHSVISLHLNSTDAYKDSPLWNTYVENDLITKNKLGNDFKKVGEWGNLVKKMAYQVNYKNVWEKGFYKKQVDELLEMLPLERAATIHSDAFLVRAGKQSTQSEEEMARRKMMRYWKERGIDLTTEYIEESYLGITPLAWNFKQSYDEYMQRPATLVVGSANDYEESDKKTLFGTGIRGEAIFLNPEDKYSGLNPNWEKDFIRDFCLYTVPCTYQNKHQRLDIKGIGIWRQVIYSDNLIAKVKDKLLTKDEKVIREGDNLFIPATWKEKEIIAYSKDGYANKEWEFPNDWKTIERVDLFKVEKEGLVQVEKDKVVKNGKISLTLDKNEMLIIAPTDTIEMTRLTPFELTYPANNEKNISIKETEFKWSDSINATHYRLIVATDKNFENIVVDTKTDLPYKSMQELNLYNNTKYYWKVCAVSKEKEEIWNKGGPNTFSTVIDKVPEAVRLFQVERFNNNYVRINWEESKMSTGYKIIRQSSNDYSEQQIAQVDTTEFIDKAAPRKNGCTYSYRVIALNNVGESLPSHARLIDHEVYLSDLDWESAKNQSNDYWALPKKDLNSGNEKIYMDGIYCDKGIGHHANGEIIYQLDGNYREFNVLLGTDDENKKKNRETAFKGKIYLDDKLVYESKEIDAKTLPIKVVLDISGGQKLKLEVVDTNNDVDSDWCIWGLARLEAIGDKIKVEKLVQDLSNTTTSSIIKLEEN